MIYDIQARCKGLVDGKVCNRYIKVKAKASSDIVAVCEDRKCKAENNIKVVMLSDHIKEHNNG